MHSFAEENFMTAVKIGGRRYEFPSDLVIGQYGLTEMVGACEGNFKYQLALISGDGTQDILPVGLREKPTDAEIWKTVTYANRDLERRLAKLPKARKDLVARGAE